MASKHAFFIALVLGLAAVFGGLAAIKTSALGQPQASVSTSSQSAALLRRGRILDRQEAALRRALAKRPPKLPRVPTFASPPTAAAAGSRLASAPSVRYVRPAPIVVTRHSSHGDEHEHELGNEHEVGDD
jgi:hypothetical protein